MLLLLASKYVITGEKNWMASVFLWFQNYFFRSVFIRPCQVITWFSDNAWVQYIG